MAGFTPDSSWVSTTTSAKSGLVMSPTIAFAAASSSSTVASIGPKTPMSKSNSPLNRAALIDCVKNCASSGKSPSAMISSSTAAPSALDTPEDRFTIALNVESWLKLRMLSTSSRAIAASASG